DLIVTGVQTCALPISLGVLVDLPPASVRERLEPGWAVLFYTDGLVERRGASIEDGMAALARAAAGPAEVESLCERVSEAMNAARSEERRGGKGGRGGV